MHMHKQQICATPSGIIIQNPRSHPHNILHEISHKVLNNILFMVMSSQGIPLTDTSHLNKYMLILISFCYCRQQRNRRCAKGR